MRRCDEQLLDEILLARAHAFAPHTPAALLAIGRDRGAFQIAGVRDRDRHLLVGHQIFQRDLHAFVGDGGTTLVPVLLLHLFELFEDHIAQLLLRRKDALVFSDALADFSEFLEYLVG